MCDDLNIFADWISTGVFVLHVFQEDMFLFLFVCVCFNSCCINLFHSSTAS